MTELREETLIKKGFWYFILPSIVLGVAGFFVPAVYVFLPVHETDVCLCSFNEKSDYIIFSQTNFGYYKLTSIIAFLAFNWIFLVTLLLKIYKIRHIHDETLIKKECMVIVGVWIVFSVS